MYAVIETGGKQRRVRVGEVVRVETLAVETGSEVVFDRVLLLGNEDGSEDDVKVGSPTVEGAGSCALGWDLAPGCTSRRDALFG